MRKPSIQLATLALSATFVFACACNKAQTNQPSAAAAAKESPSTVVATVGDKKITLGELDEHVAPQMRDLDDQRFQVRKQGLDQMVNQQLVKAEAAKKNMSEEDYLKAEVDAKVTPPTDAAIQEFFKQNSAQLPPGAKIEEYKERIVAFMSRQGHSTRAKELFDELRKNNSVTVALAQPEKPRVQVEAKGPAKGPEGAKVTLVEFSDFECPFCSRARDVVDKVMAKYDGKVRLVFRQFPLNFHKNARKAAEGALCANEQGKFWQYHDALFSNQQKLDIPDLKETAGTLGMDKTKFAECLDSGKNAKTIDEDMAAAEKVGVSGTPAFFINGVSLSGAQPIEEFERVIDQELSKS